MAEETPENKPNRPNVQKPVVPPNNQAKDKGLSELNKKLEKLLDKVDQKATSSEKLAKEIKKGADKNTSAIIKALGKNADDSKSKEDTPEGKKEKNDRDKKFLEQLKGMFEGITKGISGSFLGGKDGAALSGLLKVFAFVKSLGKIALAIGLGAIVSMMSVKDVKEMMKVIKETFEKILPVLKDLGVWMKKVALPATMTLLKETLKDLGTLFEDLGKDFKGWTEKSNWEKFMALGNALESLGTFVKNFGGNLLNYFADLFGYESTHGTLTKEIKAWFDETFSPTFTENLYTTFAWIAGLMTVGKLFGPKWLTGGAWKAMTGAFRVALVPLFTWLTETLMLYAWYYGELMLMAISPYGWAIAAGAIIATLGVVYWDEIKQAAGDLMDSIVGWLKNAGVTVNNVIADTKLGKWLGFEKIDLSKPKNVSEPKVGYQPGEHTEYGKRTNQEVLNDLLRQEKAKDEQVARYIKNKQGSTGPMKKTHIKEMNRLVEDRNTIKGAIKTLREQMGEDGKPKSVPIPKSPIVDKLVPKVDVPGIVAPSMMDSNETAKRIQGSEGYEPFAYPDRRQDGTMGKSIGYGFNLDKKGAANILKAAGISASLEDLKSGKASISKSQAQALMNAELPKFRADAESWLGKTTWNKLAKNQQDALTDMSYNMGGKFTGSGEWPLLRQAIIDFVEGTGDADDIGENIIGSKYAKQVKSRAIKNISSLQNPQFGPNKTGMMLADARTRTQSGGGAGGIQVANVSHNVSADSYTLASGGNPYQQKNLTKLDSYLFP